MTSERTDGRRINPSLSAGALEREPRRERDPITEEALRKPRKNTDRPEARKRRAKPDSVPEYLRRRPPVPPGTRKKALDWPWPSTEVKPKRRPAKPQKPDGGIVSTK